MTNQKPSMKQTSMIEWFRALGDSKAEVSFKEEDNTKVERLIFLHKQVGLPYRIPLIFKLDETSEEKRKELAAQDPSQRVAVRLVSNTAGLPKLRQRGLTREEALLQWIPKQNVDEKKYSAYLFPDEQDILWWMNFAITPSGIFGEITKGWYLDLEKGEGVNPHFFFDSDFEHWNISPENSEALRVLEKTVASLKISEEKQKAIASLHPRFHNDFLLGYFEALVPPDGNIYFNDYNQTLGGLLDARSIVGKSQQEEITGVSIFPGKVQGTVKIVTDENFQSIDFAEGDILVARTTNVDYLPLMQKAAAIVTDLGGILSHPAIIARELKRPCIVATKRATQQLSTGSLVEIDADNAVVRKLQ